MHYTGRERVGEERKREGGERDKERERERIGAFSPVSHKGLY